MFENSSEFKEKVKDKTKKLYTKIGKRNLIIILSLLILSTAFVFTVKLMPKESASTDAEENQNENVNAVDEAQSSDDCFASYQLSRKKARDEAIEVFRLVADSEIALEESRAAALDGINQIAQNIEKEANIETLIESKGFSECIAVISEDSAEVVVKSTGLLENEIVQIQEIVFEQAGIVPDNIKIIQSE